jgi:hypothetical protein
LRGGLSGLFCNDDKGERRCRGFARKKGCRRQLPNGRLELFGGYGHGVNLVQPERCARAALDFWREIEATNA